MWEWLETTRDLGRRLTADNTLARLWLIVAAVVAGATAAAHPIHQGLQQIINSYSDVGSKIYVFYLFQPSFCEIVVLCHKLFQEFDVANTEHSLETGIFLFLWYFTLDFGYFANYSV